MDEKLMELKKKLSKELERYSERDLSSGSLDVVYKLSSAVKNLCKIMGEDEGSSYAMSRRSYDVEPGREEYNYSTRRGARRDSMGRYARDGGSYRGGYSYHGDMVHKLEQMADEADNEQMRRELEALIKKMENM